jgi:TIR domain/Domain of unknown function (DUF4384)
MGNVFISYRRGDSIATAGRIRDRLVQAFGRKRVFVDVDDIPHGQDFVKILESKVAECDVLLAIIGPAWLSAGDEHGRRRLDDPEDFVAIEIASALAKDKTAVIPVLVDGAKMPAASELPGPLKALTRRNAIELRNTQFGSDAERLVKSLTPTMGGGKNLTPAKLIAALAGLAALAAGGFFGWPMVQGLLSAKPAPVPAQAPSTVQATAAPATTAPGGKPSLARLAHLGTVLRAADGRVAVKLRGGNAIKLGEQIVFEVTSLVPGKLILIDVNAAGEMVQIFPNSFAAADQITRIPKETTISIPSAGYGFSGFKAVEPIGKGTLLAVVQPDTVSGNLALLAEHTSKGFQPVAAPNAYLEQLINHITSGTKGNATADGWGFARIEYEIVR